MVVNPEFLFWYSKGNEQNVWFGGIYAGNDIFFIAFEEAMMCSDNSQAGMLFQQIVARGIRHAWLAAEQIETVTFFAEKRQHVRPVDVFLYRIADVFCGDLHADAVRPDAIRLVQQVRVFTVLIGDIEAVGVDKTAEGGPFFRLFDVMSNRLQGFRHGFSGVMDSENSCLFGHFLWEGCAPARPMVNDN